MATSMNYDQKSVYQFKTIVQIFFYGYILVFVFNFIGLALVSLLITIITTLMFAYGIYINSKSDIFKDGKFIALLFAFTIIMENLAFFFPSSVVGINPETIEDFIPYLRLFTNDLPLIILLLVIVTITGGISAIWFNKWFRNYLPKEFPQTNAFLIYGLFIIITNIVTLYSFIEVIIRFGSGNGSIDDVNYVSLVSLGIQVMNLAVGITKIIAIYKIFNRLTLFYNNSFMMEPIDTLLR